MTKTKSQFKTIHVEISSKCNLECVHCYRTMNDFPSKNIDRFSVYFKTGLSYINVSIDALSLEKIEKTRKGTDPETLKTNLIIVAKDNSKNITVTTVVSSYNKDELNSIADLLLQSKVKKWIIQPLLDWNSFNKNSLFNEEILKYIIDIQIKYKDKIEIFSTLMNKIKNKCKMPEDILHINVEGYVMPRCMYWDQTIIHFGNLNKNSINECWDSNRFSNFRKELYINRPLICKNCISY